MLAIYVLIIREELLQFIDLYNNCCCIRKQKNRPYVVSGIPIILYYYPEETEGEPCGTSVPLEALQEAQEELQDFRTVQYLPNICEN